MKKYKIKINGAEYEVNIHNVEDKIATLSVNDVEYEVEVEGITTNPTRMSTKPIVKTDTPTMQSDSPIVKRAVKSGSAHAVKAPLPGVILDIKVNEGDTVKAGQIVLILEAMKMENNIEADKDGVIEKINYNKGDAVLEGDVLFTIK
ncbi:MAG: biotin/lipoyl-binding protein [Tannerellaceae bacterium]|jgi:biotin carboxyl carrier protein|nr:biotin/lipoyl-binding protein [Tannerellaceae bacterium]